MTTILGVSAFYHDSAACLLQDGEIVAAAQEESFTRKKHDQAFPLNAAEFCLRAGGIDWSDVDWYGFYELPDLKLQRLIAARLAAGHEVEPATAGTWLRHWEERLDLGSLFPAGPAKVIAIQHHLSHACSAFYPSPFDEAAIVTVDGVGEFATATIGRGNGNRVELLRQISYPHSAGLFYSAFTAYCGFRVNSGEYKLMGLAPYGTPRFAETIESKLIRLGDDGSFRLNLEYFQVLDQFATDIYAPAFVELFGRPPRREDAAVEGFYADVAASAQKVFEKIVLGMARHARELTGSRRLCLAGGGALNCVANSRIREAEIFDEIWVQPAAGDAGGALGVAQYIWHQHLGHRRSAEKPDAMRGALLGPSFDEQTIRLTLDSAGARYRTLGDEELVAHVAQLLSEGKIFGWCQGKMEFGPRALGNRSILADPRRPEMQKHLNMSIKYRESFRPFAPAVKAEAVEEFFQWKGAAPYMLFVADVNDGQELPAVRHVDKSARLQTVHRETNPRFWRLLDRFGELTGVPALINTSFNVRGEPIVCTPLEALRCFMRTEMDYLVLGNQLLAKADQSNVDIDLHVATVLD